MPWVILAIIGACIYGIYTFFWQIIWFLFLYILPIAFPFLVYGVLRMWHAMTCDSPFRSSQNVSSLLDQFKRFTPSPFGFMDDHLQAIAQKRCQELGQEISALTSERERLLAILRTHTGIAPSQEVLAMWRTHNMDEAILRALMQRASAKVGAYE
jgi:hypothetical protein